MSQWVQHKSSGQAEKFEVQSEESNSWWVAPTPRIGYCYRLPKSEYVLCDPPERWVDVTQDCEITNTGLVRHSHPDGTHTYPCATYGYRFPKVLLTRHNTQQNQWAFIVERKEP